MDISGLFEHERLFNLDLLHPATEKPLGIQFNIRSSESDEAKRVERRHLDDTLERTQRGKLVKADAAIRRENEKAASYIAGWDWGDNTYKGEKPEFSFAKALEIIEAESWIYSQVIEAAKKLANFSTESPPKPAKR
jgi:hypothetical protein